MTKQYLKLFPILAILVFFSQTTLAQEAGVKDRWAEQALKWKENFKVRGDENTVKEQRDKLCNNAQSRVNERWNKYYSKRTERVVSLDKGTKILEKRIEFYKGEGLNVTNLEADLVALKALVGEYKTEYMRFLDLLEGAKTLPCANYEGEFLPKLKAAKDQWLVVRQKTDSIRDYYQATVKKHLEELRAQLPEEN
jgi:hypothetical protein